MHRLRFTGDSDEAAFRAAVARHDFWYHSYYFDNGFEVRGDYNIGANVDEYEFPDDMSRMSVLDVGTGSGWFAFYFEQRGAHVTTVDARGYADFDFHGRFDYPPVESEKPTPDRIGEKGEPIYYSPVSGGFWVMKDLLGSSVTYVNSRVYDLRPELFGGRRFDLVFMGAVLPHVRDPIGAVMAARRVCAGRLIATTTVMPEWRALGTLMRRGRLGAVAGRALRVARLPPFPEENPTPMMDFLHGGSDPISWWRPNLACLRQWFLAGGFREVDVSRQVTLTGDKFVPLEHDPSRPRNATQVLRLADARV